MFNFKKDIQTETVTGGIAAGIAEQILSQQRRIAAKLNWWAGRYRADKQKKLLWLFCTLFMLALTTSLLLTIRMIKLPKQDGHYLPGHIGRASDIPGAVAPHRPLTDSSTFKK
ncbi:hypothetical protein [Mucilaginibacter celer]|uniref:Uncharacterized protein n=1 Tax=Mucilaginibacter celer TaxID=2305508 RepID=A0A494VHP9_9SPHI|nr:hypothetical protein [Mucilaginibacter celer]AYL94276.1 hypothetical protein HYN43_002740 [Mucilaginibacter celer]